MCVWFTIPTLTYALYTVATFIPTYIHTYVHNLFILEHSLLFFLITVLSINWHIIIVTANAASHLLLTVHFIHPHNTS